MKIIKAVRGMHDITPEKSGYWSRIEKALEKVLDSYAYREIRMPIVESTSLFHRSIGEVTDIVEKEMYTFSSRSDESLSLRPEGTAGCVRACIEHSLLNVPQKLWYKGPMFRYERPQKGRQRQFHQLGAEVFGVADVAAEAEMLMLNQRFWHVLGVEKHVRLQLNNIGTSESRANFKAALVKFLSKHKDSLDADSLRRLESNPLRILDSKNSDTQKLLDDAPKLKDFLADTSLLRMEQLDGLLAAEGITVEYNPRLVRGLDYYNDTVFEWVSDDLGAQGAVCGGGRYDGLVEQLGGKPTPAVGFAMGLERLYLLLEAVEFSALKGNDTPDGYLIVGDISLQANAFSLAERLRSETARFVIQQNLVPGSLKSQFKKADKSGARYALILGEDEVAEKKVAVKNLQTGEQTLFSTEKSLDDLISALRE